MNEPIILVNANDEAIGAAEKLEVHQQALLHRAFSVFIFRKTKKHWEVLLQKRHAGKYHCGGLWTNTCCGHPRPGEEIKRAAKRRLLEEMGITTSLLNAGSFFYQAHFDNGLVENEIDHVFIGIFFQELITVSPKEVEDYRWITLEKLNRDVVRHKNKYTPWLKEALSVAKTGLSKQVVSGGY